MDAQDHQIEEINEDPEFIEVEEDLTGEEEEEVDPAQEASAYFDAQKEEFGLTEIPHVPTPPVVARAVKPQPRLPVARPILPPKRGAVNGGVVATRKRVTKPKAAVASQPIKKTAAVASTSALGSVLRGIARLSLIDRLKEASLATGLSKRMYQLPEGEYLIHNIGEKIVHPTFGEYQYGCVESRANAVKYRVLLSQKPFCSMSDEDRGTYSPPLLIYNKIIEGKKFTEISFIG
jgi:hypothetical protein